MQQMTERIKALAGANCILGNEMRGQIVAVSPEFAEYSDDIEDSIDFSKFLIRLDWGPLVTLTGWNIASIDRLY
jgi:hypothetical protein